MAFSVDAGADHGRVGVLILYALSHGAMHHNRFHGEIEGISEKMLKDPDEGARRAVLAAENG